MNNPLFFLILTLSLSFSLSTDLDLRSNRMGEILPLTSVYSYYVFATEWAGSVCTLSTCFDNYIEQINPQFFNIHGLWPSIGPNQNPSGDCANITFAIDDLTEATQDILQSTWSGLFADSTGFHAHEWEKHGRCWNYQPEETKFLADINLIEDFFGTVVDLGNKMNLYSVFEESGIVPSENSTYTYQEFQQALGKRFNVSNPQINCQAGKDGVYLDSVYLCLDLNYNVIECPNQAVALLGGARVCTDQIKYPVLPASSQQKYIM